MAIVTDSAEGADSNGESPLGGSPPGESQPGESQPGESPLGESPLGVVTVAMSIHLSRLANQVACGALCVFAVCLTWHSRREAERVAFVETKMS